MELHEVFDYIPFARLLGMDLHEAEDGHAEGSLELTDDLSSNPNRMVAHGGVPYALADTVGGAAVVSAAGVVAPTIDMRMDYLAPATGEELSAVADVVRVGSSVATVDIEVTDESGREIATARGVYKTGGGEGDTPWLQQGDREQFE